MYVTSGSNEHASMFTTTEAATMRFADLCDWAILAFFILTLALIALGII